MSPTGTSRRGFLLRTSSFIAISITTEGCCQIFPQLFCPEDIQSDLTYIATNIFNIWKKITDYITSSSTTFPSGILPTDVNNGLNALKQAYEYVHEIFQDTSGSTIQKIFQYAYLVINALDQLDKALTDFLPSLPVVSNALSTADTIMGYVIAALKLLMQLLNIPIPAVTPAPAPSTPAVAAALVIPSARDRAESVARDITSLSQARAKLMNPPPL
jgi:hypothetical protein